MRSGNPIARPEAAGTAEPERDSHLDLGNLAIGRLLHRAAPLSVSRPGDAAERRSDAIADGTAAAAGHVAGVAPAHPRSPAAQVLASSLGAGQPLARDERAALEARLGGDLGGVRIHTGDEAQAAAAQLRARAFAVGNHVAFGAGEFRPDSREGQRLLAHELAHTLQPDGADIQRSPIPDAAPLADFVAFTREAIDSIPTASALTVGPEVVALLHGLRGHITLKNAAGAIVANGGTFTLDRSNSALPVDPPLRFRLVVDDTATPTLGALFGGGTMVVQAGFFRGDDTEALAQALFHEMVHALLWIRRERPATAAAMRPEIASALDPSRHAHVVPTVERQLDRLFPGDARNPRVASGLIEEIVAIVETEVHEARASGQPGIGMTHDQFVHAMRSHLFGAGIFYSAAEGATVAAQSGALLDELLELLYRYYTSWARTRRADTGISGEGIQYDRERPPIDIDPRLQHRSFIPDLIRSVDEIP
jgi:hypothetical protein